MHGHRFEIELAGCTPEPLMAYLKGLGMLRLVSEQADPSARGWWRGDTLWLESTLDVAALMKFFIHEYAPTPLVTPWAGGSGFFSGDNQNAVEAIASSAGVRFAAYRSVITTVQRILQDEEIVVRPSGQLKVELLKRYRRELPDAFLEWLDAAMVLLEDGQAFAPLLGTGGNDGRLDFAQNFMGRLVTLGITSDQPHRLSEKWLNNTFFGSPVSGLERAAVGQFAPGRAGGPNNTQGMEAGPTDNPWDYILALEGTLMLASATVRRLQATDPTRASFPFTVRPVAAGYASAADTDEQQSRGEIWLPLWTRRLALDECRILFAEGRADVSGRRAQTGLDFARAVATLGVDRGIATFSRYLVAKRSGKAYLASPVGRVHVRERSEVDLLGEIDSWLERFRRAASDSNAPRRFRAALHTIDEAIFDLCRYGGPAHLQSVLIALGRAERELAVVSGRVGQHPIIVQPLRLSPEWIERCDDGRSEFAIAVAIAAVHDRERRVGALRTNLEPVRLFPERTAAPNVTWTQRDRRVVWTAPDLATNMAAVLERRCMDAAREGCRDLPLASSVVVGLDAVADFINGDVDDQLVSDLVWGLIAAREHHTRVPMGRQAGLLSAAYPLLKLLFLPRPLTVERLRDGTARFSLARPHYEGIRVKPEPAVLHLLRARRIGEACALAARRLRTSGLVPVPRPIRGKRMRDDEWGELDIGELHPRRLAAALLIPISDSAVNTIAEMITRPNAALEELERSELTRISAEGE